ncbi:hypothetical protein [Paracoccus sp. (in: a-proteobacteria)]|uniref:hypothetical protein n=1 Tax=Paracoccus sp. TaxID=267 RepID=UPI003A897A9C
MAKHHTKAACVDSEGLTRRNLTRWRWSNAIEHITRTAPQWEPLALIECGGTLVRHRQTGRLAEHRNDRLVSVNERKAEAALEQLSS